jgi:ketosteroid isomerase-like protein
VGTKETVLKYYDGVARKEGWQQLVSDDIAYMSPAFNANTKTAYIEAAAGFFKMVKELNVKELVTEGDKAFALVHYDLVSPKGKTGICDVAELFSVKDGKIASMAIFYDTAAFSALTASFKE